MTKERMNLDGVRALVVDSDHFGVTILVQMLHGLGMEKVKVSQTAVDAQKQLEASDYELCICEADLPDMPGPDLIKWLRRLPTQKRFMPTLVLTGYADFRNVTAFRDAGANLVMRKPASPQALYDRIAWISESGREFVECESYIGPDRRFKSIGPPGGVPRRSTDLSTEIGQAVEPNMTQDEIDGLMRPTRVQTE